MITIDGLELGDLQSQPSPLPNIRRHPSQPPTNTSIARLERVVVHRTASAPIILSTNPSHPQPHTATPQALVVDVPLRSNTLPDRRQHRLENNITFNDSSGNSRLANVLDILAGDGGDGSGGTDDDDGGIADYQVIF